MKTEISRISLEHHREGEKEMAPQERLQASIDRINAGRIAQRIDIGLGSYRTMVSATTPTGVTIDVDWIAKADDAIVDQILKHELIHYACLPGGGGISDVVADLGQDAVDAVAQVEAQRRRAAFSKSVDAVVTAAIPTMDKPSAPPAIPAIISDYLQATNASTYSFDIGERPASLPSLAAFKKVDEILKTATI